MEIKTHKLANSSLLGKPVEVVDGEAIVELKATDDMAVDEKGLIHGGFTFGLADYAAMLAVNHPNVVLGASDVRFLGPVQSGDMMVARAVVSQLDGRRRVVNVEVKVGDRVVLSGTMACFVLDRHVLER
jgi:acyl-coenzyme A thioesterase PaaI-like protein